MNLTFQPDFHQEFTFADNTDSFGCCCCWSSKTVRPNEYYVNSKGQLERFYDHSKKKEARLRANQRLQKVVEKKFRGDPIDESEAVEEVKKKTKHDFSRPAKIKESTLNEILVAIYEIKKNMGAEGPMKQREIEKTVSKKVEKTKKK